MPEPMARAICGWVIFLITSGTYCRAEVSPDERLSYGEKNYYIVHELKYDWQVYDKRYKTYVPYIREKHANISSVSFPMDLQAYKGYELVLYTDEEVYLFINATLQKQINPESWDLLRMDSLSAIYKTSPIFLSFYSPSSRLPSPIAFIGHRKSTKDAAVVSTASTLTPKPRTNSRFNDFVVLACLFILGNYAFLWNLHPNAFNRFYSIKSLFGLSYRDDVPQVGKPLNGINLLFILNHGFLLALLYMLIREGTQSLLFPDQVLRIQESLPDYLFNFLVVGLVIFLLIILKYLATYVLGNLFSFEKLVNVHFFEYIHFSKVFYTLVVPVLVLVFTSYPSLVKVADNLCIAFIIGFSFLRILVISISLNKLAPHRNLYLFSYLCVTELAPLLTGIKILL